ncbi:hypothetical protein EYR40_009346 [Pleurotus pulmonarius]|nr:hypothetical protein EYR36_005281 [Pleurotus pulmonarius]KAF4590263.1 hypothetical protein EYR38_009561 [Pleurotus pulmonarius]KAF4590749.1 hypothetical protein EYR40_009346 [Pleurotus pulmonarius]
MPLSDKAKGKQRAREPSDGEPLLPTPKELVFRFTEGIPDLQLHINAADSVKGVKQKLRALRPQVADRRLRLIHSGRLLTDGIMLYEWLSLLEERQKRALDDTLPPSDSKEHVYIHCSVGPKMDPSEEEAEESMDQSGQLQPARGFDRLVALGFSEDDVNNFRQQFHSHSNANYLDSTDFETEEEYSEHARALEEQWIDSLASPSGASLASSPSASATSSILQGLVVGFFFPLIPFFFMRKTRSAAVWENGRDLQEGSVIFSRRMQMGLVVGFIVNLMFGLWRLLLDSS